MRVARLVLLVLGAVLLGVLIARNDPGAALAAIAQLGWRLGLVVCFPFVLVTTLDTLGWRFAFARDRVPFPTLLAVRLAGEAFNLTTPTASVGGEAVKAWLVRRHVPYDDSVSSVIVAKTSITLAQGVFLVIGIVVAARTLPPGSPLLPAMEWLLGIEAVALTGFVLAQVGGVVGWIERVLRRLRLAGGPGRSEALVRLDGALSGFYRRHPCRLLTSVGFHLAAWMLGALETYLSLRFLGLPVSLATATIIEAVGTGVRFATFLVPASLGALEGGFVATFSMLGLGATAAVSFSLVRRVREATWVAVGLGALALLRTHPAPAVEEPRP